MPSWFVPPVIVSAVAQWGQNSLVIEQEEHNTCLIGTNIYYVLSLCKMMSKLLSKKYVINSPSLYWTSQYFRWFSHQKMVLEVDKPRNTIITAKCNMFNSLNYIKWYILSNFALPKLMEIGLPSLLFLANIFVIPFSFFNHLTVKKWLRRSQTKLGKGMI